MQVTKKRVMDLSAVIRNKKYFLRLWFFIIKIYIKNYIQMLETGVKLNKIVDNCLFGDIVHYKH